MPRSAFRDFFDIFEGFETNEMQPEIGDCVQRYVVGMLEKAKGNRERYYKQFFLSVTS